MARTLEMLQQQLIGIRHGTVTPGLVSTVKVPYYGQLTPLDHLAVIQRVDNKLSVLPHDVSILKQVEKALVGAGLNAYVFSKTSVVVSVPQVTGEEKAKVHGHVKKLGEDAKVAIRNLRKKAKQKLVGHKEELRVAEKELQELTDSHIGQIEEIVQKKIGSI
jgi:ribosome recycling factor